MNPELQARRTAAAVVVADFGRAPAGVTAQFHPSRLQGLAEHPARLLTQHTVGTVPTWPVPEL